MDKISLCICTFKRPKLLNDLLTSICNMNIKDSFIINNVIIVDNDESKSASKTATMFKERLNIVYDVECKRGISAARNRCLDIAVKSDCDFIVFLDDDELVSRDLLINYIDFKNSSDAKIIAAPVITLYRDNTPKWIISGGFFYRKRYATGETIKHSGCGNVMLSKNIIEETGIRFDDSFGLSGGEDTKFFTDLSSLGHKIYWCDEAEAYEYLQNERANIKYILKRSYTQSINYVKIERQSSDRVILYKRLAKAAVQLIISLVILPFTVIFGKRHMVRGLQKLFKYCGQLSGLFNLSYDIYKN